MSKLTAFSQEILREYNLYHKPLSGNLPIMQTDFIKGVLEGYYHPVWHYRVYQVKKIALKWPIYVQILAPLQGETLWLHADTATEKAKDESVSAFALASVVLDEINDKHHTIEGIADRINKESSGLAIVTITPNSVEIREITKAIHDGVIGIANKESEKTGTPQAVIVEVSEGADNTINMHTHELIWNDSRTDYSYTASVKVPAQIYELVKNGDYYVLANPYFSRIPSGIGKVFADIVLKNLPIFHKFHKGGSMYN